MVHQVATHRAGAVRDAVLKTLAAGHEQQLRPFDRVRRDDDVARAQPGLAAVRLADQYAGHATVSAGIHAHRDRLGKNVRAGSLRFPQVNGRIVLGLHRANRDA